MPTLKKPYLIFIGDTTEPIFAKTAFGLRDWCRDDCVGQWRLPDATVDLELPDMDPAAARQAGAKSMVVGVANIGGSFPDSWLDCFVRALEAGLDLIAGMHTRLANISVLSEAAQRGGSTIYDLRFPPSDLTVATGVRRTGKRLLTVGSDCALGKKYTALALTRLLTARGVDATFRATGQTGIMIAGEGIAIDAVISDFASGAAERLSPPAAPDHWDVIEGQGAIIHPAYSGVTLALLHGSQPDAMVLCHDPTRTHINGFADHEIWPLPKLVALYETLAKVSNPNAKVVGISLNTSRLSQAQRESTMADIAAQTGLPVGDPMIGGLEPVVDWLFQAQSPASQNKAASVP